LAEAVSGAPEREDGRVRARRVRRMMLISLEAFRGAKHGYAHEADQERC